MVDIRRGKDIRKQEGKLGCLIPGIGAVTSTLLAGVFAFRKGLARPLGSVTQVGKIRLGKRTENRMVPIREFVPLAGMDDLVFGGWDVFPRNAYQSALNARVLDPRNIEPVKAEMEAIEPMKAVFNREYVKNLDGPHVKKIANKMDQAQELIRDIEDFQSQNRVNRLIMCWAASTEAYRPISPVHRDLVDFEAGLKASDPAISPSQIYAYAALKKKIPFINGAPHISVDCPALLELAETNRIPVSGKDFKTGQTLMKTIIAPGLQSRMLGVQPISWATATARCWMTPIPSNPRKSANSACWTPSSNRMSIPNSTKTCTTKSESIIIPPGATTRNHGTTSISSAGWITPCKSRSISSAGTRYWQPR